MVDSKIKAGRSIAQDVALLFNSSSHCLCTGNSLHLRNPAGIFMDAKKLMAIFGRQ